MQVPEDAPEFLCIDSDHTFYDALKHSEKEYGRSLPVVPMDINKVVWVLKSMKNVYCYSL